MILTNKRSEDSEPSKTDVEKTLNGILGWVQKKKIQAENPKTKITKSSPWGLTVGLVVAVLIFFALAFVAWRAWKKGREIAKLKHELDKKKEQERKVKINEQLTKNDEKRKQLEDKAVAITASIMKIKIELAEAEAQRNLAHKTIDKITSWEDVNKIIGKPNVEDSDNHPTDRNADSGSRMGDDPKRTPTG